MHVSRIFYLSKPHLVPKRAITCREWQPTRPHIGRTSQSYPSPTTFTMYTKAFIASLALAGAVIADDFKVATPANVAQCQPAQLKWQGGQAPYYPSLSEPGSTSKTIKVDGIPQKTEDTSLTWKQVSIKEGTKFVVVVRDSTGAVQNSAPVTVSGGDDSCLNGKGGGGGGGAGGGGGSSGGSGDDKKGGDKKGDDKKSSGGGGGGGGSKSSSGGGSKSSSGGSKSSSKSSGGSSSSKSGGDSSSTGGSDSGSTGGAGGAGGSSTEGGDSGSSGSDGQSSGGDGDDSQSKSAAATFRGLPAVAAGVVGVVVAALI